MDRNRAEWRVSLYKCNVGKQKGKEYPRVIQRGTVDVDRLVRDIIDEGSEFSEAMLRCAAGLLLSKAKTYLKKGYAVSSSLGTLSPGVSGMWNRNRISEKARQENKAHLNYAMSKEMKEELKDAFFIESSTRELLYISRLTNLDTGEENERLLAGETFMVNGDFLLMNGNLPERGLYFIHEDNYQVAAFIPAAEFRINTRSEIIARLPKELLPGRYRVKIVSQCTTSPRPMKQAASAYFRKAKEVVDHM